MVQPEPEPGGPGTAGLTPSELEQILLGGRRQYTRAQAAERAGISLDTAIELWHALGFASVADDVVAFTEDDVTAMSNASELVAARVIAPNQLQSVTRMVGQSMSRLADWQSRLLIEVVAEHPELLANGDLGAFIARIVPALEQVQVHVWRRQLAAAAERLLNDSTAAGPQTAHLSVGFVDLAGYTSLSRQIAAGELSAVLERFESLVSDLVAQFGGRVVKTIGDEVLFAMTRPRDAAEVALGLQELAVDRLPQLRIGLATGSVLTRFGDVYGPVVNIASRLTSLARPGTVLIDRELAAALDGDRAFDISRIRPVSVRGYPHLNPFRLRRRVGDPRPEPVLGLS